MTTHNFLSDPLLQRTIIGCICGILLGFGHKLTRRLFEAVALLGGVALIILVVSGQGALFDGFDPQVVFDFLITWKFELAGLVLGLIVGYSIVERSSE